MIDYLDNEKMQEIRAKKALKDYMNAIFLEQIGSDSFNKRTEDDLVSEMAQKLTDLIGQANKEFSSDISSKISSNKK